MSDGLDELHPLELLYIGVLLLGLLACLVFLAGVIWYGGIWMAALGTFGLSAWVWRLLIVAMVVAAIGWMALSAWVERRKALRRHKSSS